MHVQSHRNRFGYDKLLRLGHRGRRGGRHPQFRGRANHAFICRIYKERGAAGRAGCQAPGRHQQRAHHQLHQARDGHGLPRQHRRKEVFAPGDLGDDPSKTEGGRGGLSGRGGHGGCNHGARLLHRCAAPGHQGRGHDRRTERQAHHQRAHRGGPGLRRGQGRAAEDHGLRPGRRHLRRIDSGHQLRRHRGSGHGGQQPAGRRRLRQVHRGLSG